MSDTTTPAVEPGTACLLRSQDRLLEIVTDVGDTFGNSAAAPIAARAVALFCALKELSREAQP